MTRWEYLNRTPLAPLTDRELASLGEKGWELASFAFAYTHRYAYHYIFKRPVEGEVEVEGE